MAARKLPRPTNAELSILRVLWSRGPSTVREVHGSLKDGSGYTTVLKQLQVMAEKGLVVRDERERAHVYAPKVDQERTQRQLVEELVERVFGGSPVQLAMQALSSRPTDPAELAELKKLLDTLTEEG
jgi:predicted transcriptional regulator